MKTKNEGRESLRATQRPISGKYVLSARSLPQAPPSTQSLLAAIDRLIARALALAFFDLDYSVEIELARRLAVYAEGRASA